MRVDSPFMWVPANWQLAVCVFLTLAALPVGHYLRKRGGELDQRLQYGVLDIEAPWTRQHAKEVRGARSPHARG